MTGSTVQTANAPGQHFILMHYYKSVNKSNGIRHVDWMRIIRYKA